MKTSIIFSIGFMLCTAWSTLSMAQTRVVINARINTPYGYRAPVYYQPAPPVIVYRENCPPARCYSRPVPPPARYYRQPCGEHARACHPPRHHGHAGRGHGYHGGHDGHHGHHD